VLSNGAISQTFNNPNPVFKVTLYFDDEYVINGAELGAVSYSPFIVTMAVSLYGHSYYERRIGNCAKAFKWYQFE